MKYEICLTPQVNEEFHRLCSTLLTNEALAETNIIPTSHSNYWDATRYIIDSTLVSRIDKVQIVTSFLYAGGNVKFNGTFYHSIQVYGFWKYLLDHKFITEEEYNSLK